MKSPVSLSSPVSGPAGDPCGCPAGFHRCGGRCLARQDVLISYPEAESLCDQLDAHLAVPRSEEENTCARRAAGTNRVWLGITDRDTEGQFTAADGCGVVPTDSSFWGAHQPNNRASGEDFVALAPSSHEGWAPGWHDTLADDPPLRPLCQLRLCRREECP